MTCLEIEIIGAKPFTFDFNSNLTENTVIDSNLVHNVSNHFKNSPEWQGKESQMHGLSHVGNGCLTQLKDTSVHASNMLGKAR